MRQKKEIQIRAKLNRLLNETDMDWGILICAKKHDMIFSVHLCDEEDSEFVNKLHEKLWEGCPIFSVGEEGEA